MQTWIPLLGQALAVIITALGGLLVTRRTGQAALLNETIVNLRGELTDAKATLAARTQERDDAERRLRDAQFQIETRDERIGRLIDRLDGQAVTQPPSTQPPSPSQGSAP